MTTTPRGLKTGGRRLWSALTAEGEPDEHSAAVLAEACHTVDLLAVLRAELAETRHVIEGSQGPRVHPLVVEVRQQRLALAKLIASLGLPKGIIDPDNEGG